MSLLNFLLVGAITIHTAYTEPIPFRRNFAIRATNTTNGHVAQNVTTSSANEASASSTNPSLAVHSNKTSTTINPANGTVVDVATPSSSRICSLDINDPATWADSGAGTFLESFLAEHGETDWLVQMDYNTTLSGPTHAHPDPLDCKKIGAQTCTAGQISCEFFTPPEYFWIRAAAVRANQGFASLMDRLGPLTDVAILSIDQMLADFVPTTAATSNLPFAIIGALFGVFSGAFGAAENALASGLTGVASGAFGGAASAIAGESSSDAITLQSIKTTAENSFAQYISNVTQQVADFNDKLFGGDADIEVEDILRQAGKNVDTSIHGPTNVFADFVFLPEADSSAIDFAPATDLFKQGLASVIMRLAGYYVFVDQSRTQDDCNGITGSRWLNNQCYTIESRRAPQDPNKDPDTAPMDRDTVLKLDDPNADAAYNFDLPTLYRLVDECNNGEAATTIPLSQEIPKCFYGMYILKDSEGRICNQNDNPDVPQQVKDDLKLGDAEWCPFEAYTCPRCI